MLAWYCCLPYEPKLCVQGWTCPWSQNTYLDYKGDTMGTIVDYNLHWYKAVHGVTYAQTRNLSTHDMHSSVTGAIAMGPSDTNYQGGMEFYSLKITNTLHGSPNNVATTLVPANALQCWVVHLTKDSRVGLWFINQLGNPYNDDPENNNGSISWCTQCHLYWTWTTRVPGTFWNDNLPWKCGIPIKNQW